MDTKNPLELIMVLECLLAVIRGSGSAIQLCRYWFGDGLDLCRTHYYVELIVRVRRQNKTKTDPPTSLQAEGVTCRELTS